MFTAKRLRRIKMQLTIDLLYLHLVHFHRLRPKKLAKLGILLHRRKTPFLLIKRAKITTKQNHKTVFLLLCHALTAHPCTTQRNKQACHDSFYFLNIAY